MTEQFSEKTGNNRQRLADLREIAIEVLRTLRDRGFEAYLAGGCVRDRLMGHMPTDYDVATSAKPEQVRTVFRRVQFVGESFGVMLVKHGGFSIEVATFRTDGVYADGRHPDSITYSDAEHDALRRDFTINGLFEDPLEDRIIDYIGGQEDIRNQLVRGIGNPMQRLREDRLRLLRGIRFAARFGFAIETETADAIRAAAGELVGVSRERIGHELQRMLEHEHRGVAAWELQYHGLDEPVLNEPHQVVAPMHLGRLPDDVSYPTALAAWLIDRHSEQTAEWDSIANRWASSLVLSNDQQSRLKGTLRAYRILRGSWQQLGVAEQKRLASDSVFNEALLLLQACDRAQFVDVRRDVEGLAASPSGLKPDPLVTGDDLIQAGFEPGPRFKRLLDIIYDAQLEDGVQNRGEAMRLARFLATEDQSDAGE